MGLAVALAVTRVLAKMLFGVTTTDPTTFVGVSALLIGIVLVACSEAFAFGCPRKMGQKKETFSCPTYMLSGIAFGVVAHQ